MDEICNSVFSVAHTPFMQHKLEAHKHTWKHAHENSQVLSLCDVLWNTTKTAEGVGTIEGKPSVPDCHLS